MKVINEFLSTLSDQARNLATSFPASVLIFAGSIKLVSLVADQPWESLLHKCLLGAFAIFEISFGVLLTSKWKYRKIWGIAIFIFLAAISLVNSWFGQKECGCFGVIKVDPRVSCCISLVALFSVASISAKGDSKLIVVDKFYCILVSVGISLVFGLVVSIVDDVRSFSEARSNGSTVLVRFEEWIGQELPLVPYLQGDNSYRTGNWTILVYDSNCLTCRESLVEFCSLSGNLALIELPMTTIDENLNSIGRTNRILRLKLSSEFNWLIQPGVKLYLTDGKIQKVDF